MDRQHIKLYHISGDAFTAIDWIMGHNVGWAKM